MSRIYSVKDFQIRCNSLNFPGSEELKIDGMNGPATQKQINLVMRHLGIGRAVDMFHPSGIIGIVFHWAASSYNVTNDTTKHYNGLFDHTGIEYDGGAPAGHQAQYSRTYGVSHTLNNNTGFVGLAVSGMGDASANWGANSVDQGKWPLTWKGVDAMLKKGAFYCKQYDIRPSKWTTLTHAEVQPSLNITQRGKWDFQVLPESTTLLSPIVCGDILRKRMVEKFW